jgi:hypothetical protein
MITGLVIGIAVIAAVLSVAIRRWRRGREVRARPGAQLERALIVSRFDEIDAALQTRACPWCGGILQVAGETSRLVGERRFRIVRLVCQDCERDERVHFDVTAIFH